MAEHIMLQGFATQQAQDEYNAQQFAAPRGAPINILFSYLVLLLAGAVLLAALAQHVAARSASPGVMLLNIAAFVALAASLFVGVRIILSMAAIARVRRKTPLSRELSYLVDHEAIRIADLQGEFSIIPWRAVSGQARYKDLLLLRINQHGWHYVLLRAFSFADQKAMLAVASDAARRWRPQ